MVVAGLLIALSASVARGPGSGASFNNSQALIVAVAEWNTDQVTAEARYGPIGTWNVSYLTTLAWVFCAHGSWTHNGCNALNSNFNGDISSWDVSRVRSLYNTWNSASSFNQPIGNWDTSSLDNSQYGMYGTFGFASAFDQPLRWNVSGVSNFDNTFYGTGMSECNRAITNTYFTSSPSWSTGSYSSSWSAFGCPPSPPLAPSPEPPPQAPSPAPSPPAATPADSSSGLSLQTAAPAVVQIDAGGSVVIRTGGSLVIGAVAAV